MAYVLILMLSAFGSNGGNALATARFDSQGACEAAGKEAQGLPETEPYGKRILFRCVPVRQ